MVLKKNSVPFIDTAKLAIEYLPKGFNDNQLPPPDISPSYPPGDQGNPLSISPLTPPTAAGSSTMADKNMPITPPQLKYVTTGIQTTPSLIREVSPSIIGLRSPSEDEGAANEESGDLSFTDGLSTALFQTPNVNGCYGRRRVVVESDEEDEEPSQSIPGAYPPSPSTPTLTIIEKPLRQTIPNVPPYWLLEAEANLTPKCPPRTFNYSFASESPTPGLDYYTRVGPLGRYPSMPKRRLQNRFSAGRLSSLPSVSSYEADGSDRPCCTVDADDEADE